MLTVRNFTKRHFVETALRVSEQRSRTAFDSIPDVVAIYDNEFRILYVNHALTSLTQRPDSSFIGRRRQRYCRAQLGGDMAAVAAYSADNRFSANQLP